MKNLPTVLLLCAFVPLALSAQGEIRPNGFASSDRTMAATTAAGPRVLTLREIRADVILPSGKHNVGVLLIVFDPASGYYLSRFGCMSETSRPVESWYDMIAHSVAYIAHDQLVLFTADSLLIYVVDSTQKASVMNEAQAKALADAKGQLAEIEKGPRSFRFFSLAPVGQDFIAAPGDSRAGPTRILDVARQEDRWELTVQGQWRAKITVESIDGHDKITHFRRVPPIGK